MQCNQENPVQLPNITLRYANSLETCNKIEPRLKLLFARFAAIFGYSWTSNIAGTQELLERMREWDEAIHDLSNEQIERAIKKCKYTCEFINISTFRKAALCVTSPEVAYSAISSDPLSKQAWEAIDFWSRKTMTEKELKKLFIANYTTLSEKLLIGGG